jgi:hypothetical protein
MSNNKVYFWQLLANDGYPAFQSHWVSSSYARFRYYVANGPKQGAEKAAVRKVFSRTTKSVLVKVAAALGWNAFGCD